MKRSSRLVLALTGLFCLIEASPAWAGVDDGGSATNLCSLKVCENVPFHRDKCAPTTPSKWIEEINACYFEALRLAKSLEGEVSKAPILLQDSLMDVLYVEWSYPLGDAEVTGKVDADSWDDYVRGGDKRGIKDGDHKEYLWCEATCSKSTNNFTRRVLAESARVCKEWGELLKADCHSQFHLKSFEKW